VALSLTSLTMLSFSLEQDIVIHPQFHDDVQVPTGASLPQNPTPEGLQLRTANFRKTQKTELFKKKQKAYDAIIEYITEIKKAELGLFRLQQYEKYLTGEMSVKVQEDILKMEDKVHDIDLKAEKSYDPRKIKKAARWKKAQKSMLMHATDDRKIAKISVMEDIESKSKEKKG